MVALLEFIFQGFFEWVYGLILDIWNYFSSSLLNVMSLDFAYIKTHIPVMGDIQQIILAVGWALLLGNLVFQALRSMAAGLGFEGEDPKLLFARTFVFGFLLLASPQICELVLGITSKVIALLEVPDAINVQLVDGSVIGVFTASWILVIIFDLITMFMVLSLLLEVAERYMVLAMLTIMAPLAFAMGGSKSTSEIFAGWCRMFGSMCFLMATNIVFFKMLLSVVSTVPNFPDVFLWMVLIVSIVKVAKKADEIITRIGLNPAITGNKSSLPGVIAYTVFRTALSMVTKGAANGIGGALGLTGKAAAGVGKSAGRGLGTAAGVAGSGISGRQVWPPAALALWRELWQEVLAERRRKRPEVPAMAEAGARQTAGRNRLPPVSARPSRTRRRRTASVRQQRRNAQQAVSGQAQATHSVQIGPAGKHLCSPAHTAPPAMSNRLMDRQKRRKNPHPAALPAFTGRRAAASQAAPPAVAAVSRKKLPVAVVLVAAVAEADLPRILQEAVALAAAVVAAVSQRKLLAAVVSAAAVAEVDSPRIPQEAVALAVSPEAAVLAAQGQKQIRPVGAAPSEAGPAARPSAMVSAAASPKRAPKPAGHRKAPPPGVAASVAVPVGEASAAQGRKQTRPAAAEPLAAAPAAQPGGLVLAVHSPKHPRKQRCPNPVQQERGSLQQLESLALALPVLSLAQQEWVPAAPIDLPFLLPAPAQQEQERPQPPRCPVAALPALSPAQQEHAVPEGLPPLNPGTAGIFPRHPPRLRLGRRVPGRHSRNRAGPPRKTSLR